MPVDAFRESEGEQAHSEIEFCASLVPTFRSRVSKIFRPTRVATPSSANLKGGKIPIQRGIRVLTPFTLHDDDRDDLALLSSGFSSTVVATLA